MLTLEMLGRSLKIMTDCLFCSKFTVFIIICSIIYFVTLGPWNNHLWSNTSHIPYNTNTRPTHDNRLTLLSQRLRSTALSEHPDKVANITEHKVHGAPPSLQFPSFLYNKKSIIRDVIIKDMTSVCPNRTLTSWNDVIHKQPLSDIMLIVILNYNLIFKNLPRLEFVHRPVFKHIVYCGPELDAFVKVAKDFGLSYVTYMEVLTSNWTNGWHFYYECVAQAMKLSTYPPVKGYLSIGDDVLLNHWNLHALDRNRMWIPYGFRKANVLQDTLKMWWMHWTKDYGRNALLKAMDTLQLLSDIELVSDDYISEADYPRWYLKRFATEFLHNYDNNIGRDNLLIGGADFFYIPRILKEQYILASDLFKTVGCFVELAVPAIRLGLSPTHDVIYVDGRILWTGKERQQPWAYFHKDRMFMHPFKLGKDAVSDMGGMGGGRTLFCDVYLRQLEEFLDKKGFDYKDFTIDI